MLYPLFIIGGAWFYTLIVIESIVLMWCLEKDEPWFANGALIVFFCVLWFLGDFNVFAWIKNNPVSLIKGGISYIILGLVYSVAKYTFYLTEMKRKYDRKLNKFLEEEGKTLDKLTDNDKHRLGTSLEYIHLPTFTDSTKSIIFWMMYWPWSGAWTILNNPVKWIFEELYDVLSGLFKRIHYRIIGVRIEQIKSLKDAKQYDR